MPTKGERTSARILEAAQALFASQGYAGTSLRQIAEAAGIREPGLYNHYTGKSGIYEAVLQETLKPLAGAITRQLDTATSLHDYTELPSLFIDLLLEQPHLAALLQQALQDSDHPMGADTIRTWILEAFERGMRGTTNLGLGGESDRKTVVINVIAMINLTTGYFLSRKSFADLGGGDIEDPENLARQKQLLHKVIRAMLIS